MPVTWRDWWKNRGEERLTLLLWAVWNPIGTCPLDEYASYSPAVAAILREAHDEDSRIAPPGTDFDARVQRQRNQLWERSVERLATLLGQFRREQMEMASDVDADRHAAATLLDWYEWEMAEAELVE